MRDSALKLHTVLGEDDVEMVGEELMRDSALKLVVAQVLREDRRLSEKSSCATAL